MNDLKFNAVLSASFAAALTVACYPLTAPVISCVFDSLPVDWLSWLDSIGLDMWSAFWLSGAWLGHIPFMFAAFCLLFLFLLGYVAAKDAGRTRSVDDGIYGDAHSKGLLVRFVRASCSDLRKDRFRQDPAAGAGDNAPDACGRMERRLDRQTGGA